MLALHVGHSEVLGDNVAGLTVKAAVMVVPSEMMILVAVAEAVQQVLQL
jgi:hypothetical protein